MDIKQIFFGILKFFRAIISIVLYSIFIISLFTLPFAAVVIQYSSNVDNVLSIVQNDLLYESIAKIASDKIINEMSNSGELGIEGLDENIVMEEFGKTLKSDTTKNKIQDTASEAVLKLYDYLENGNEFQVTLVLDDMIDFDEVINSQIQQGGEVFGVPVCDEDFDMLNVDEFDGEDLDCFPKEFSEKVGKLGNIGDIDIDVSMGDLDATMVEDITFGSNDLQIEKDSLRYVNAGFKLFHSAILLTSVFIFTLFSLIALMYFEHLCGLKTVGVTTLVISIIVLLIFGGLALFVAPVLDIILAQTGADKLGIGADLLTQLFGGIIDDISLQVIFYYLGALLISSVSLVAVHLYRRKDVGFGYG